MKNRILSLAVLVVSSLPLSLNASEEEPGVEMTVRTIVLDPLSETPVVLLESSRQKKTLPIWIGNEEATSIALELKKVPIPRPNTHDLIRNILQGLGAVIQRITITDLRNDIYYATITLKLKGQDFQIDSRPSDAIAVALRMKAPIFASGKVLASAKPLPTLEKPTDNLRKTLGIQAQDLTPELASLFDLKTKAGILVADVDLGSPASEANVQRGDVILKVNDKSLHQAAELESLLRGMKTGAALKMEMLRKGSTIAVTIDLPS